MRISSIIYSFKQGIHNIFSNILFSLASISTMAACIFLFGLFFSIVTNVQYMLNAAESLISISVFFDDGLEEDRILEIGANIGKRVEVAEINYTSSEDAWENFKLVYFKGNEDLARAFADDNPLSDSSSYEIFFNDITMQDAMVTYLESIDGVRQVNRSETTANSLSDFGMLVGYVSAAIIIILLAVAIFLISNTIAVGITVRKEEVSIMKLIGATDHFVKAPFLIEGILIGLVGAAIPLVALYYFYNNVVIYILDQFQILSGIIMFLPADTVFKTLVPVALALGVGIGYIGSSSTLRRHIKV
ncbi:MAG: ABC transporter permease [Clostridiales bacterium]|nr:ABC transporter permease [Clostridiales bacterium]